MSAKRFKSTALRYCIVMVGLIGGMLSAQATAADGKNLPPMLFDHLGVDAGLSQSNVLAVLQDSRGLMWFATEHGLNRYDGYQIEQFKRERGNPDALSNDFIFDIVEDANGDIWLATNGGGLVRYERSTNRFQSFHTGNSDITSNQIRRLAFTTDGTLWLATSDAGLISYSIANGTFATVALADQADKPMPLYALHVDARGALWVGGQHGLSRLNLASGFSRTWQHDPSDSASLAKGGVRAILQDAFGSVWVGTYGGGLDRLSDDGRRFEHFTHDGDNARSLSGNRVTTVFEDSERRLWVGTTAGLNLLDRASGDVQRFVNDPLNPYALSANRVTSIYEDRSGLLWVGTQTNGVNKWNPRTWGFGFDPAKSLTASGERSPNVTAFTVDANGVLWLGTFGDGLHAIDRSRGKTTHYRSDAESPFQIPGDRIMSLLLDRDGTIWVGTMRNGLVKLNPATGKQQRFTHDPADATSIAANGVTALFQDSAGRIWVGTYGRGISRMDRADGVFKHFAHIAEEQDSLSGDRIMAFAEDASGMMWVGTEGAGLNLFNPVTERFHRYAHDPQDITSLASETVYSINIDADATVWVGTRSGGLDRVVGSVRAPESITFNNLSEADGLANDVVYGIQFDQAGWMWLSTNHGISRFNARTGEFRNLVREDGLQSNEFNFGAHFRSSAGELFFGGHKGFNAFQPADVSKNSVAPLIALTGFFNGNDSVRSDLPINDDGTVEVDWRQTDIAFEFAALDFTAPEQNRYQYMLAGRDEQWIDLGTQRRITYTDLGAGDYTLRVRAANSDGVWNEAGFTLPISVAPAPWNTWWAYLIYAALAVASLISAHNFHRRRLARESAYSSRLEDEVQQRTEKLVESNAALKTLNVKLQESSLSDPLTGLRNRRYVFEEVSRDIEAIQRRYNRMADDQRSTENAELVFMMIDLDNFKPINDTYGHAAGDQMLLEIRDILLNECRRSDSVVRWGGDEFVVIAKQTDPVESEALAERIRAAIESHQFKLGDGVVARTTCSIGFVAYPLFQHPNEESSLDHMICVADGLMYEAKRQRNAWVGMLSADSAVTSDNFDHSAIEATSLLFRAKRARHVDRQQRIPSGADAPRVLSIAEAGS
ncbi:MAG: two-component regulator propeller domain-containing protein [Pseudomonadota bacterium]